MTRRGLALFFAVACSAAVAGCSALKTFAMLTPTDSAERLAVAQAYGRDPRQKLDVYGPGQTSHKVPVVMFFYGGGWSSGSRADYGWAAKAIASRGFVVVVPDYRLVPQVTYPDFVEDGASATRWAQDHAAQYGGDPQSLYLTGHSAGAYIALMLALDDDFLRKAGVNTTSIRGAVGLSGPYDFYPFDVKSSRDAFGGYPDPKATQPISYAGRPNRPAVLLIQGENDKLVGPYNSVNLDRALLAAGNRSTLHLFPGLSHPDTVLALSVPFRGKAPILSEMTAFMKAHAAAP